MVKVWKNIGKMNLSKKILLFLLLLCNIGFAQENKYPKVLTMGSDTVIVFSFEQGKEITIRNEKLKFYGEENNLLKEEIIIKDTIISLLNDKVEIMGKKEDSYKTIIKEKDALFSICEKEKKDLKTELDRQRFHKWLAISGAAIIVVLTQVF
jgi:hypothetical protein